MRPLLSRISGCVSTPLAMDSATVSPNCGLIILSRSANPCCKFLPRVLRTWVTKPVITVTAMLATSITTERPIKISIDLSIRRLLST